MNFRYVNGYMFREDYETVIEAQQFLNKLEVIIPHSGGWYIGKEEYVNAVPLGAGEDAASYLVLYDEDGTLAFKCHVDDIQKFVKCK